jgi:hypothetical protein
LLGIVPDLLKLLQQASLVESYAARFFVATDWSPQEIVGYRNPPFASRFRKGQSGNHKGRPRGRRRELPYEADLAQEVIIRETVASDASPRPRHSCCNSPSSALMATVPPLGRQSLRSETYAIPTSQVPYVLEIISFIVDPGSVSTAVECLRIGTKLDRYRETARMMLEPWIVEAALARLGEKHLTPKEQEIVLKATRTPTKVRLVGGYAVRLIGRIHRAPRTIFGRAITPAAAALEADEPMIVLGRAVLNCKGAPASELFFPIQRPIESKKMPSYFRCAPSPWPGRADFFILLSPG